MRAQKLSVIRRALDGIEALPPMERAALLEGAALLMRPWARAEAQAAMATAQAIRSSENLQLSFAALLKEAVTTKPQS